MTFQDHSWWLMPRTLDPEVGGSSPTRVKPCCVLEQGTFTPPKVLVIPRKRWLRPNMTEKLFTGTLRINQHQDHSLNEWMDAYTDKLKPICSKRSKLHRRVSKMRTNYICHLFQF